MQEPPAAVPGHALGDQIWTVPNLLSLSRLLLVPVFAWAIVTEHDALAWAVLATSGFTDWLDGYLARRLRQMSRLGQLLDPAADRLYIITTLIGLGYRGIVPWWVVGVLFARDAVLAGTIPLLARVGYGPLPVHFLGKAATASLLYAFPLLLWGDGDSWFAVTARVVGWAFAWWGTGMYWWAGLLYLRQVRELTRAATTRAP